MGREVAIKSRAQARVKPVSVFVLMKIPTLHLHLIDVKVSDLSRARYYAEPIP